ncbi:efflux transporter, RND family, MFP subunit [compost metagenome]
MVLYTVLLDVDNSDNSLMAEMTTQVFFVAQQAKDTLTAPIAALHSDGESGLQSARVVAKNGDVESRKVRTGISDRQHIQILDGLNEGDYLLIGPATGTGG